MTGLFKAHKSGYFYGKPRLTSKEVVFFSKEKFIEDWLKESPYRVQITAVKARDILEGRFKELFDTTMDAEKVEPDPEWDAIKNRTKKEVRKQRFNPYRDFNINYKGETF